MPSDQPTPTVVDDISAMYRTNYMGFASFTLLIWDHIDTFEAEVEYIWKGKKGLLGYLFLINRYLTPLGFIVNLFAYLSPVWTPERCSHFIRFEGSMTVIGINIVALMMFLRIYALYKGRWFILGVVIFLFLFQVCMNGWLLTRGVAVVHNELSGVLACTMIFDPAISVLASSSAWLPLLYDTVVLLLTLNRTIPSLRRKNSSYVMKRLLEDGLIYYAAIFAVTGVLTIMIIAAPPGLKNITAQLELLLTVAMMSRITLNLKKSVSKLNDTAVRAEMPSMFTQRSQIYTSQPLKIVTPGFNDLDLDDDDREFPVISIASPRTANGTSTTNLESEVSSSWGNTWSSDPNYHDPIEEVESGENVRFQARITLDRSDLSQSQRAC
ncbi:hypothetical protein GALMADRAFT_237714 [Galerina marginata CBS 339.88]|uniref:DUF6533 domain-containing protein n=1 Tax=Galerina marginata (strain CBS 339.88) TaxID=685588 RepID=A0A067TGT6_GALM3|nr:hypothetical protein GALMADRAFT_237714 [Galerina marginata CBS 339.88]